MAAGKSQLWDQARHIRVEDLAPNKSTGEQEEKKKRKKAKAG